MKIFIGWSGDISRYIARGLRNWIPLILQKINKPFVSTEDISKGSLWFNDMAKTLKKTDIGIFCITPENLNSTWMHYEAGIISRHIEETNVCPFLFKLKKDEIISPFKEYQLTEFRKDDVLRLLKTINNQCTPSKKTNENTVLKNFKSYWPQLLKIKEESTKIFQKKVYDNELPLGTKSTIEMVIKNIFELVKDNNSFLKTSEIKLSESQIDKIAQRLVPQISQSAIKDFHCCWDELVLTMENEILDSDEIKEKFKNLERPISHIFERHGINNFKTLMKLNSKTGGNDV